MMRNCAAPSFCKLCVKHRPARIRAQKHQTSSRAAARRRGVAGVRWAPRRPQNRSGQPPDFTGSQSSINKEYNHANVPASLPAQAPRRGAHLRRSGHQPPHKSPFFQTGRAAIFSPAGQFLRHKSRLYGLDLAGNRPKSITSRRNNKMETKHRRRPATLPHGGKMLAACSRQAIRFCYRCNLLQCRLGSQQPCEPLPVKRGAPEKPADPNQPRRKATQQAFKQWNEDLRSQRQCPNCNNNVPRDMPNCGYCKTALGNRQEQLMRVAQVEPPK